MSDWVTRPAVAVAAFLCASITSRSGSSPADCFAAFRHDDCLANNLTLPYPHLAPGSDFPEGLIRTQKLDGKHVRSTKFEGFPLSRWNSHISLNVPRPRVSPGPLHARVRQ